MNWDEVEDIPRQHLKNYLTQDLEQEKVRLILLREAGNVKIAVEAARTVASLTETYYGPDNLEYGTATNNLGVVLNEAGLFREFEAAHRESLRVRASAGELSEEVAQSLDNLAQSLSNSGDAEAALTIAQRALQVREQVFGSDHLEVAFSLNTLANIYIAQEKFVERRRHLIGASTFANAISAPITLMSASLLTTWVVSFAARTDLPRRGRTMSVAFVYSEARFQTTTLT